MSYMKRLISNFSIIALAIVMLVACKSPVAPSTNTNNVFEINIKNGAQYASQIDAVEFYADNDNGGFTLCRVPFNNGKLILPFPETIADEHLVFINGELDPSSNLSMSDPTARVGLISYRLYKNGQEVENFKLDYKPVGQSFGINRNHFMYANKPVVVSASGSDDGSEFVLDLNLKQGYNLIFTSVDVVDGKPKLTLSTSSDMEFEWSITRLS